MSDIIPDQQVVVTLPLHIGMEHECLRGMLTRTTGFRLFINGTLTVDAIDRIIRLLEAQKAVLSEPSGNQGKEP